LGAKLRYLFVALAAIPAFVAPFLGSDPFITNFNSDGTARTSFPPFVIPILWLAIIGAIEFYRIRLRSRNMVYADWIVNGILLLMMAGMIYLDLANVKPEWFFG
jgi:hypothetical protein